MRDRLLDACKAAARLISSHNKATGSDPGEVLMALQSAIAMERASRETPQPDRVDAITLLREENEKLRAELAKKEASHE